MKKKSARVGTVVAIPVKGDCWVAARIHKESYGVLNALFDHLPSLTEVKARSYAFFGFTVDTAVRNGEWPVIGMWKFSDDEDPWYPPTYRRVMSKPIRYFIHHGLNSWEVEREEILGMQRAVFDNTPEDFVSKIEEHIARGTIS